ncbi:MAG: ABC transporter permease, partial [Christensenellales bacterium]
MNKKQQQISNARKQYLKKLRNKKIFIITCQIVILIAFFGLWQLLADTGAINVFVFSSPSRVFKTIGELFATGNLMYHIGITLMEAVLGFLIATGLGFIIAVLLWWNETLRRILEPYIIVLNSLPKIALGPII